MRTGTAGTTARSPHRTCGRNRPSRSGGVSTVDVGPRQVHDHRYSAELWTVWCDILHTTRAYRELVAHPHRVQTGTRTHAYHGGTVHFLILVGASLAGAVAAVVLAVRALSALRKNRGRPQRGWRRVVALLACSGAVSLYVWGMLHVLSAVLDAEDGGAGSSPLSPCREAGDQIASRVVGYDVGYVWLRFDCRLSDGGTYTTSAVPGYVNPVTALLGVTAVVFAALPAERANRRTPVLPSERHDS